jgi:hypothetical protein
MTSKSSKKVPANFICKLCDYNTSRKSQFSRHILTSKHLNVSFDLQKSSEIVYTCECGKKYKHRQSIYNHKKKCDKNAKMSEHFSSDISSISTITSLFQEQIKENKHLANIVLEVVKENRELKEMMLEQNKQLIEFSKEKIVVTNNINNKFNLNFFLNEQCKDALNIMDFVNSLQVQIKDLENVGKSGYTEGISKIFIKGLQELDVFKRPVHCSDIKRETIYIKDKDAWEKEKEDKHKLINAIKHIAHKNIKQLPVWIKENPNSNDCDSKTHMEYIKIVNESMGGLTEEDDKKNYDKIIKNVAKEIIIEKV